MKVKKVEDLIEEIRKVQKKAGLTDEKIAFYGNLSKSTVSQLLSGKSKEFTFQTLLQVAEALDCELEINFEPKSA